MNVSAAAWLTGMRQSLGGGRSAVFENRTGETPASAVTSAVMWAWSA